MDRPVTRTIAVVTGSRAEYGLLSGVMAKIAAAPDLRLQVLVTGMHLSPEFGLTFAEIEQDGFTIDRRVETLLSADTGSAIAKSMGLGLIGFGEALAQLRPDMLLVLGDRFEILAAVSAALVAGIPVAHLHGGELTEGACDDAIRHAITKMSHLHFVAAAPYRDRVIQLGESPDRVFTVGGLGVDRLQSVTLLDRAALETSLDFRFGARTLLVTFHPATLESASALSQLDELLSALEAFPDVHLLFTMPNADADGRALFARITAFVQTRPNARAFVSLGHHRYLSCLAQVDGVVGNSSSGLAEVPSFQKGTVNIGERQTGRLKAASVIDCQPDRVSIQAAITRLYSPVFQSSLPGVTNPYGSGGASAAIVDCLRTVPLVGLVKKVFYDMPQPGAWP
jgi:GDP/UDP-N,N'-diacetylbacillosamine 2-epimerase (hydrolysing)